MTRTAVFLLMHEHVTVGERDEVKMIGVYSTREKADAARARMKILEGFKDYPEGFSIDETIVDKDHWTEGFVTL